MAIDYRWLPARSTYLQEFLGDRGGTFSLSKTTELANLLQRIKRDESYYFNSVNQLKKPSHHFN
jgi:hypothetical protein